MPLDKDTLEQILKDIQSTGVSSEENRSFKPLIASRSQLQNVINLSSGMPRIRNESKFNLILSQPLALQAFNPFEIRCCLCKNIISYPCWYYSVRYAVNVIHYFICFDSNLTDKPTARCYKR